MRILSFFFFFVSFKAWAVCGLQKNVVSLSGVTTVVLKEIGLLAHPKLHGISVFNPIKESEFHGPIYPGGIFLSQKALTQLQNEIVLFDESRELDRIFSEGKVLAKEVRTRNLTPRESTEQGITLIRELTSGCEGRFDALREKVRDVESKILRKIPAGASIVFYLGPMNNGRMPQTVIGNDGFVKWLKDLKRIKSYPSDLAYVTWSSKIMLGLTAETYHVAVVDSARNDERNKKVSGKNIQLSFPGALVPGLTQLEALLFLVDDLYR